MNANTLFLTNVICPLLSGIPLLCFAFYFFYSGQGLFWSRARLFPLFLLAFSLFILGRPLQLFLGPYPWPVVINCLRVILFAGICCPLALHEARGLCGAQGPRARLLPLLLAGGALAALYSIVLVAGTTDTPLVFELGPLRAYDSIPPSLSPPFFPREITIITFAIAGVGFFGRAGYETLRARQALGATKSAGRHLLYFAIGCLIFAGAFLLGNLSRQWWFYYMASVPVAFFIGLGVREDMLYTRRRVERVIPFLRDELFHAFGSGARQDVEVQDLKTLLGKEVTPTRVLVIGLKESSSTPDARLTLQETARRNLASVLDEELGEAHYLLLPVGAGSFAVCLDASQEQASALTEKLLDSLAVADEGLRVMVGIGGSHPPRELQHSYLEAQTAFRAAGKSGRPLVSYINLGDLPSEHRFPVQERGEFLLEFRHVHGDAARRRLEVLLDQVTIYAEGDVIAYRVSLVELLGSILGECGEQARGPKVRNAVAAAFEDLNRLQTIDELKNSFITTVDKLLAHVESPRVASTSVGQLQRATAYINENLSEALSVGDVAKRAGFSISQLQRIFQKALGMTYSTYLTTMRIQRAKELLAGTDRSITDIAFDVGYNDSTYFSTAFRKHEGIPPSQYRKQGKRESRTKYKNRPALSSTE